MGYRELCVYGLILFASGCKKSAPTPSTSNPVSAAVAPTDIRAGAERALADIKEMEAPFNQALFSSPAAAGNIRGIILPPVTKYVHDASGSTGGTRECAPANDSIRRDAERRVRAWAKSTVRKGDTLVFAPTKLWPSQARAELYALQLGCGSDAGMFGFVTLTTGRDVGTRDATFETHQYALFLPQKGAPLPLDHLIDPWDQEEGESHGRGRPLGIVWQSLPSLSLVYEAQTSYDGVTELQREVRIVNMEAQRRVLLRAVRARGNKSELRLFNSGEPFGIGVVDASQTSPFGAAPEQWHSVMAYLEPAAQLGPRALSYERISTLIRKRAAAERLLKEEPGMSALQRLFALTELQLPSAAAASNGAASEQELRTVAEQAWAAARASAAAGLEDLAPRVDAVRVYGFANAGTRRVQEVQQLLTRGAAKQSGALLKKSFDFLEPSLDASVKVRQPQAGSVSVRCLALFPNSCVASWNVDPGTLDPNCGTYTEHVFVDASGKEPRVLTQLIDLDVGADACDPGEVERKLYVAETEHGAVALRVVQPREKPQPDLDDAAAKRAEQDSEAVLMGPDASVVRQVLPTARGLVGTAFGMRVRSDAGLMLFDKNSSRWVLDQSEMAQQWLHRQNALHRADEFARGGDFASALETLAYDPRLVAALRGERSTKRLGR